MLSSHRLQHFWVIRTCKILKWPRTLCGFRHECSPDRRSNNANVSSWRTNVRRRKKKTRNPFFSALTPSRSLRPPRRPEEANGQAGGGRHAGGDEGGEEEDGHGEEGVHPGAVSLPTLPPAHHHLHPAAALPAAVRDQRSELLHGCLNDLRRLV